MADNKNELVVFKPDGIVNTSAEDKWTKIWYVIDRYAIYSHDVVPENHNPDVLVNAMTTGSLDVNNDLHPVDALIFGYHTQNYKRYDDARKLFEFAERRKNIDALIAQAWLDYRENNLDRAEKILKVAIILGSTRARANLGLLYIESGRVKEAIDTLTKGANGENSDCMFLLATIYLEKDSKLHNEMLIKAVELKNPRALFKYGMDLKGPDKEIDDDDDEIEPEEVEVEEWMNVLEEAGDLGVTEAYGVLACYYIERGHMNMFLYYGCKAMTRLDFYGHFFMDRVLKNFSEEIPSLAQLAEKYKDVTKTTVMPSPKGTIPW